LTSLLASVSALSSLSALLSPAALSALLSAGSLLELALLDEDLFEGDVEFLLAGLAVGILVDGLEGLHGLLLVEAGLVAHLLEDIVEEGGQFLGVEAPASVAVVLLEHLLDELLQLLVSDHHWIC
jgi:uncharacterized membrane protein YhhN